MFRNELFGKLAKVNKDDRILLLTHDDADGAGAEIVLRCMFPDKNIKVVHLSNGVMSGRVKEAEKIDGPIITIRIAMTAGYRRMFGFAKDLWKLEKLYIEN